MSKNFDQFVLAGGVILSALLLGVGLYGFGFSSQFSLLGLVIGACYLILSIRSYGLYASCVLEGRGMSAQFVILVGIKILLLLLIFLNGSHSLVMGMLCGICLIVPASLGLLVVKRGSDR